ncbi:hypothetical protein O181_009769 [Austropuccinia psidii MF-1]|uniref:Uncharacterized protein n=1 Tax=Austropuccinia psidii MF-1 TaxID=1389203 RepID=A0A9Q3BPV1_9BASI|nr:hypothetical protein [Austropuccinia psidii MF-1]
MPIIPQFKRRPIETIPPISKPSIQSLYVPPNPNRLKPIHMQIRNNSRNNPFPQLSNSKCSPTTKIPPVDSSIYEEKHQEINVVPKTQPVSSIQCTPTLAIDNIPLPVVYCNLSTTI